MNNEYENVKQDLEEDWTVNEPNFHSKRADSPIDGEVAASDGGDPQNQAGSDDWAMNTMVSSGGIASLVEQIDAENRTTDAPNTNPLEEKHDNWRMPEPVFRVSSGKNVEKSASVMPHLNLAANQPAPSEPTESTADIQPQPYISEEFLVDKTAIEKPPAKAKSRAGRIILIAAGILAMVIFAVGFLIGIYFLFFHQPQL